MATTVGQARPSPSASTVYRANRTRTHARISLLIQSDLCSSTPPTLSCPDAGVVIRSRGGTRLDGNQIFKNAGAGIFADDEATAELANNMLFENGGEAMSERPGSRASSRGNIDADQRPLSATVVRRQRVPFDWTVGKNVTPHDKSLKEKVAEMRSQYAAMSGDGKETGALMMLPDGSDASVMCLIS